MVYGWHKQPSNSAFNSWTWGKHFPKLAALFFLIFYGDNSIVWFFVIPWFMLEMCMYIYIYYTVFDCLSILFWFIFAMIFTAPRLKGVEQGLHCSGHLNACLTRTNKSHDTHTFGILHSSDCCFFSPSYFHIFSYTFVFPIFFALFIHFCRFYSQDFTPGNGIQKTANLWW